MSELDRQLERLFAGPVPARGAAARRGPELDDARAFSAARDALRELARRARRRPGAALDRARVHDTLAELRVRVGREPAARPRAGGRARAASARGASRRCSSAGSRRASSPRGAAPEPFLPDDDRRRSRRPAGCALPLREDRLERERYLFYVCASRAERLLVLCSRYCDEEGSPRVAVVLPRRRARTCSRSCPSGGAARCRTSPGSPERAPTAGRAGARRGARGPRRDARRRRARSAPRRVLDVLARAGRRFRRRARALRRLPGQVARGGRCSAPTRSSPTPSRWSAAATRTTCSSGPTRGCASETGEPAGHAGEPRRGRAHPARGAGRAQRPIPDLAEADARARRRAPARVRPAALPPPRGRADGQLRAGAPRAAVRHEAAPRRDRGVNVRGHDRPRGRLERPRARARLQERQQRRPLQGRQLGSERTASRRRSTCWPWSALLGLEARGRRLHAARRQGAPPARPGRRPSCATSSGADFARQRLREPREEFDERWSEARGQDRTTWPSGMRRGELCCAPGHLRLGRRLLLPRRSAGPRSERPASFTAEQRRGGRAPRRLAARARGRRHRQDLGARGALRARVIEDERRRRLDPRHHLHREGGGRAARARARAASSSSAGASRPATPRAPGSRPSTASARGCCARTRSRPGIDPDTGCSTRSRRSGWRSTPSTARCGLPGRGRGPRAARDGRRLHDGRARADGAHRLLAGCAAAASRAELQRRRRRPPAGERERARARRPRAALRELGAAGGSGWRPRSRLERCERCLARLGPGRWRTRRARGAERGQAAQGAQTPRSSTPTRRRSPPTSRSCAAQRQYLDRKLLRELLALFGAHYERLKRERSGLDFEDLELITRDLLAATRAPRARYAGASAT